MKILSKLFGVVAAIAVVSCATDVTEDLGIAVGGQTTLTISLEESRTQLGEKAGEVYPLYWSEGDQISVNGISSSNLSAEAEGSATATFSFNGTLSHPYNVVYPANANNEVTFLAQQNYVAGTFTAGAAPMCGYAASADEAIQLQNLAGILRIAVSGNRTLSCIVLEAEQGNLAGTFAVDCATGALTLVEGTGSKSVTYTLGEGLALSSAATPLYIAVPAGNYGKVTIVLYAVSGEKMTLQFDTTAKPVLAGIVREFGAFEYDGVASDEFIIDSKEALIAFAANHTKDARVTANIDMTGVDWTPIESYDAHSFNGSGFKIKGLNAPLFGSTKCSLRNVHLEDVDITVTAEGSANAYIGALACQVLNENAVIENCSASGKLHYICNSPSTSSYPAGLVANAGTKQTIKNLVNKVDITITGSSSKTIVCAGCIPNTNSLNPTLQECQNLGNILCDGTYPGNTYICGVAGNTGNLINCTNGCKGGKGVYGTITTTGTYNGYYFIGGVNSSLYRSCDDITNCINYGNLLIGGTRTHVNSRYMHIGGVTANCVSTNITDCKNYGDIICSINSTSNLTHQFAGVACCNSKSGVKVVKNCENYGKIEIANSASIKCSSTTIWIHGVVRLSDSIETMENLCNYGELVVNGKIDGVLAIGGITGEVLTNSTFKGTCTNIGNITIGATSSKATYTGGIIGLHNNKVITLSEGATLINKGAIKCTGTVSEIAMGGIFGLIGVEGAYNGINIGDIEYTGTKAAGSTGTIGVGGFTGVNTVPFSGAIVYCSMWTELKSGAGFITGSAYSETTKVTNCKVGGSLLSEYDEEDERYSTITLNESNYYNHIYSTPVEQSVAEADGCSALTTKPVVE